MYKFRRLRALLQGLSVTGSSQRRVYLRWLWVILGYAAAIGVALAEIFKTSHDWPITWRDVAMHDEVMRSFLLSSYVAFVTGCSTLIWVLSFSRGASARMLPLPDLAPALRQAVHNRDPRIIAIAQNEQSTEGNASESADALPPTALVVATPDLLTQPLGLVLAAFAGGMFLLGLVALFVMLAVPALTAPPSPYAPTDVTAEMFYTMLRFAGIFAVPATIVLGTAWRFWIRWLAKCRGARVAFSVGGLTICDQETLWRRRFIAWSDVESLACFTYNDSYVRPRTVYLLDAGRQTFLWETPPTMRYESPRRRARIAQQQAQSTQLLALIGAASRLPLLNISGAVNTLARIEPDPYSSSNEPDPQDIALLRFVEGASDTGSLDSLAPQPTKAERWRRLLISGLVGAALIISLWFFGGIGL